METACEMERSAAEELPPLPESLSGVLSSGGGLRSGRARIQADCSRGRDAPRGHRRASGQDAALALLRKEMVGLRQLDMSLLRQLWSLREAIQEYKGSLVSDNEFSEEEEEEEEEKGEEEDEEETGVHTEPLPSSSSLSPPLPSSNSRDQWIKDSFHVP